MSKTTKRELLLSNVSGFVSAGIKKDGNTVMRSDGTVTRDENCRNYKPVGGDGVLVSNRDRYLDCIHFEKEKQCKCRKFGVI